MDINSFYNELLNKKIKLAVVGLGYVGLPLLLSFSKHFNVIGFDINKKRIRELKDNIDKDNNIDIDELNNTNFILEYDPKILKEANFFIIAVPTPVDSHNIPDLDPLIEATKIVGLNMPRNSVIVYESTVYPGVTEDICIPILEKYSNFKNLQDFLVGYSPERINPGDRVHKIENIIKIVSGQNEEALQIISKVYCKIIKAGIFKASSIKVAESAKVIENIQRDVNIALVNELSIIFRKLNIDLREVLEAAKTKWNFLDFSPGLVGGHCIGVDPYYLVYKSLEIGYHPEIINAGRRINDNMGFFIGEQILKTLIQDIKVHKKLKIIIFGITFKENVSDIRNTKVVDIYNFFKEYGMDVKIFDPIANKEEVKQHYGIELIDYNDINYADALIFCVAHDVFKKIKLPDLRNKIQNNLVYLFDIKWIFTKDEIEKNGFKYWSL